MPGWWQRLYEFQLPSTSYDAAGDRDWGTFFDMRDEYKASLSVNDRAKLEADLQSRNTPLDNEYLADLEVARKWLSASRDMARDRGLLDLYKQNERSPDPRFSEIYPLVGSLLRDAKAKRDKMRENDIALDRKLYKWGFIETPYEGSLLEFEVEALRRAQGGLVTNRLDIDKPVPVLTPGSVGAGR